MSKLVLIWLLCIGLFLGWVCGRMYCGIAFNRECGGYLKRAADANTVELAKMELARAIDYLTAHGMTEGYTSILYRTPDEDIGFWYRNLTASHKELENLPQDATALERSNALMKLRETLLDDGKEGSSVTAPGGISVFPHNHGWALWGLLSFLLAGAATAVALAESG